MSSLTNIKTPAASKPTSKVAVKKTILATHPEILEYVAGQIPAPEVSNTLIDTSNIEFYNYRTEDADINAVYTDFGITGMDVVDADNVIIPHARLIVHHKSGSVPVVPFFAMVLLMRKATIELNTFEKLKNWALHGSMKARGNTHKFIMSQEQIDAAHAKARMNWESTVQDTTSGFISWLGSYQPSLSVLEVLYHAYTVHAALVQLGDSIFIRQVIAADSEELPIEDSLLPLVTSTPDLIGDVLISTCYTYKLAV